MYLTAFTVAILAFLYISLRDAASRGQSRKNGRRWLPRPMDDDDDADEVGSEHDD